MLGFLKTLGGAGEVKEKKTTKTTKTTKKEEAKEKKTTKKEKTKSKKEKTKSKKEKTKSKKEKTKSKKEKTKSKDDTKPVIKRFRKKIVMLGLPASGKGTVAHKMAMEHKVSHLSSGKILRTEVESGSDKGKEINELMSSGKMVPNEYLIDIIRDIVKRKCERRNGFILDGFPRNLEQAKILDQILKENDCELTDAVLINIPYSVAKERAMSRGRGDDNIKTINNRIHGFEENTKPVIEFYKEKGLLRIVNGNDTQDKVYRNTLSALRKAKLKKKLM